MQENLFFWNAWEKPFRAFYLTALSVLALCLLCTVAAYFFGDTATIGWTKDIELETTALTAETQTVDFFNFHLETNAYITRSWIDNGNIKLYPGVGYAYLITVVLAILVLITIFTFLDLIYFLIGITTIIVFIVSLNTELLSIFGWQHRGTSLVLIALYAGTAYWLHAFSKNVNFFKRFFLLLFITLLVGVGVGLFAESKMPFYQLTQSSLLFPFAAFLFFLYLTGFENIRLFLYISSSTQDGKKGLLHFSIISLLYIANALLLWSKNRFIADHHIILIHPLVLFISSGLSGIYGYKKRNVLFSGSLPFKPYGGLLYLSLFIISSVTLAYGYFTANDALYNSMEYFIVYFQLCFSIGFFLYVLINFAVPMFRNLQIYPYLFSKPAYTPLFTVQGMGLLGVFGLLALNHYFSYDQSVAAHYNQLGDYYARTGDTTLAYRFYNESTVWDLSNQKANYTMATMAEQQDNYPKAFEHYNACLKRKPNPYALVGLSGVYQHQNQLFPSFFMLKDGVNLFPDHGPLQNNLGLTYQQLNIYDSAFYFLERAHDQVPEEASINLLYLCLKSGNYAAGDSLQQTIGLHDHPAFENNVLALNTAIGKPVDSRLFNTYQDSLLTPEFFTYAYNYTLNHLRQPDTLIDHRLSQWLKPADNDPYKENLITVRSLHQYYGNENARTALLNIHELEAQHPTTAYYPLLLAHWYVSKRRFDLASEFYLKAYNQQEVKAQLYYVLCLLEDGHYDKAQPYTEAWLASPETDKLEIAKLVKTVATENKESITGQTDLIKLRFIRWNIPQLPVQERLDIASGMQRPELKVQAQLGLMEELMESKQYERALQVWNQLPKSEDMQASTIAWGNELYLRLLVYLQDWETLRAETQRITDQKLAYYKGIDALVRKDSSAAAKHFIKALEADPLDDELAARALLFLGERDFLGYYDLILTQLLAFPESVKLSETYMLLCINNGMDSYAEGELNRIEPYLNEEKYRYWKKTISTIMVIDNTSVE